MASLRRVRKNFRKDVLRLIGSGDGSIEKLVQLARQHFGHDVGYEVLIKTFLHSEVGNAVNFLRQEGRVETVGRQWIAVEKLQQDHVDQILSRRKRRIYGELESLTRFANSHGRFEDSVTSAKARESLVDAKKSDDVHSEQQTQDVHAV